MRRLVTAQPDAAGWILPVPFPDSDGGALMSMDEFYDWWAGQHRAGRFTVTRLPFAELEHWAFEEGTGNLRHSSGRFFTIEGLRVLPRSGDAPTWSQPIIHQPEVGILGIIVKEFDGVLHCLMQAKMEPGNVNTLQLSPTVQATRSNYTQVHQGSRTRYLEHFAGPNRAQVLVDVLQSEQGAWFWRKRNRNMVVLVQGEVPIHDNYCWLTLPQIRALLKVDNLVNMDARTVLSCMPFAFPQESEAVTEDRFRNALVRSYQYQAENGDYHARHTAGEILSWFNEAKTGCDWTVRLAPLREVDGWTREAGEISDADQRHFRIIGVGVEAGNREVRRWTQPLLYPRGQGRAVFVTRAIDGVLHVLVQARPEYGLLDQIEMAPTVQVMPGQDLEAAAPSFLRGVLTGDATTTRFDTLLSEEGGRFYRALTRYQIVEAGEDFPVDVPAGYCWMTVRQMTDLLRHGHYLNVEARSLLACIRSLC